MNRMRIMASALAVTGIVGVGFAAGSQNWRTTLGGYEEVPAVSSGSSGDFTATVSHDETSISWQMSYEMQNNVLQSHLHFGSAGTNGGVSVFLCTNLGNGPAGTQPCPQGSATIGGTLTAADVVGPTAQGIAPGEFGELIAAIRAGHVYANVHSTPWPGGEVRGQLTPGKGSVQ